MLEKRRWQCGDRIPHSVSLQHHPGFAGRIAVYEIMDVTPEIKEMIVKGAGPADIKRTAVACGMHTLHRSAAELVVKGITTVAEMRKVSSET